MYSMKQFLKLIYFRFACARKKVKFSWTCNIGINSHFEGLNVIGAKSSFSGFLGRGSYIVSNCHISGKIGRYCSIASNVNVIAFTHPVHKFVSTHPAFYSLIKQNGHSFAKTQCFNEYLFADKENKYPVIIGNDVWLGFGTTLIGGITIGDGAVILANSTVTKNVDPYTIVGGIPAKPLKKRFDEETIAFLLNFRWWDKPESWIYRNADYFCEIDNFIANVSKLSK